MEPNLKVLELGGPAAGYCGRLFTRLGAVVTRLSDDRSNDAALDQAVSLYLHDGKHTRPWTPGTRAAADELHANAGDADIVVANLSPAQLDELRFDELPCKVRLAITPFGRTGPYSDWQATGSVLLALGGYTYLMGDNGRAPLTMPGHYAEYQSGQYGYVAALAHYLAVARGGQAAPVSLDLSMLETVLSLSQFTSVMWTYRGQIRQRNGNDWANLWPLSLFRCADGWVMVNVVPGFWEPFTAMLQMPQLAADPRFATNDARMTNKEELRQIIEQRFADQTMAQLLEAGQRQYRVPTGGVMSLEEVLNDPHLSARGFWETRTLPDGRAVKAPRRPFQVVAQTPCVPSTSGVPERPATEPYAKGPLNGVRIVDFTHVWAGPLATRILADLGADVIKVEAPWARGPAAVQRSAAGIYPNDDLGAEPWNRQGIFNKLNRNKRSLAINLKDARGQAIVKDLVRISDVVIDNFSARAMGSMGFGYDVLSKLNPAVVQVAMPGYGISGPYRDFVAFGPSVEPMSGLTAIMGYGEEEPRATSIALPDAVAGVTAAAAVLSGLYLRATEQHGSFVEMSLHEGEVAMLGEYFLLTQMQETPPARLGNAHPVFAPHGVYRCVGQDEWIAVACRSDEEWRALAEYLSIDRPEWRTRAARQTHRADIDADVGERFASREQLPLARALQLRGVPAGGVFTARDFHNDPQLRHRRFFKTLGAAHIEALPYPGLPVQAEGSAQDDWRAAPRLSDGNRDVLRLLGREAEYDALLQAGVLVERPPETLG